MGHFLRDIAGVLRGKTEIGCIQPLAWLWDGRCRRSLHWNRCIWKWKGFLFLFLFILVLILLFLFIFVFLFFLFCCIYFFHVRMLYCLFLFLRIFLFVLLRNACLISHFRRCIWQIDRFYKGGIWDIMLSLCVCRYRYLFHCWVAFCRICHFTFLELWRHCICFTCIPFVWFYVFHFR